MAKQKIAFVVAVAGTAHAFLLDHMSCLAKEYKVHLIANFKADEKLEFETIGIICHDVPIMRDIKLGADWKALCTLRRLFRSEHFDCVHSVTPKAGLLTAVAGWLAGVPHRIHIFTGQVWATRKGFMRALLKLMDKVIALLDTDILVDGEGQRQFLIKEGVLNENNSRVLANGSIAGVKLDRFVISDEIRRAERAKFGFEEDDVVFIFLGRLNHDKGIGELFEAFDRMLPLCPDAKLVLYGYDEEGYDSRVESFANMKRGVNYFYPGHTSTPYASLQVGDVFVLPTWREGFGMSVLEAQGLGMPAITSDAYGVVDATIDGLTALRFKVGDAEGLSKCMKTYYEREDLRSQHGMAGRKRVETDFDGFLVIGAWIDYYHYLLDKV